MLRSQLPGRRQCDPLVGTKARSRVCSGCCSSWYGVCRGDYFAYDTISGKVAPCHSDSLLCSPLEGLVSNGTSLCDEYGLREALPSSRNCYDGIPPEPLDSCLGLHDSAEQRPGLWQRLLGRATVAVACLALSVCAVCLLLRGRQACRSPTLNLEDRVRAEHQAMLQKRLRKFAVQ